MELHCPSNPRVRLLTLVVMTLLVSSLQTTAMAAVQEPLSTNQLLNLEPATTRERLQAGATAFLSNLLSMPANQEVRIADANPVLVSADVRELVIPISDQERVTFQQRSFEVTKQGMQVWYGDVASDRKQRFSGPEEVDIDPFNNAMIVRDGEKLVGNVRVAGQAYRLDALENGKHALIKVDELKLPTEAEPLIAPDDESRDGTATSWQPKSAHSYIGVLVVTTNQSRELRPNAQADIVLMVSHANQVNKNSGVEITFEPRQIANIYYEEGAKTNSEMLRELATTGSGLGATVDGIRKERSADLVTMLIARYEYCGLGYTSATRTSAFSTVTCTGSFGHELGHNLGASHNWEPGSPVTNPPYKNGYRYSKGPKFHTQMSYGCGADCPRIDFWSTPLKSYQGVPLGTAANNDSVRRFNERREYIEGFYP